MKWVACAVAGLSALTGMRADTRTAFDLNERGVAIMARGDYAGAEQLFGEALTVWRGLGLDYAAHAAATQTNLGLALCGEGKWKDGARVLEEALAQNRRVLGAKHVRTVYNLNMLGNVSMLLGDMERAEALYGEALGIERDLYPESAPLAQTLAALAALRTKLGKPDEGLPLAEEALTTTLKIEGESNLDAANMYQNVARIHTFAGRPERAIPLFRKARAIWERAGGPQDAAFGVLLTEEGLALMGDGQTGLAERSMKRSLDVLSQCTACGFQRAIAENNLGLLRFRQRKYDAADALLTHALSLEQRYGESAGFDMAATLETLSALRVKQRRFQDAAELKQRAAAIHSYR